VVNESYYKWVLKVNPYTLFLPVKIVKLFGSGGVSTLPIIFIILQKKKKPYTRWWRPEEFARPVGDEEHIEPEEVFETWSKQR
jgi:hypothetical protein